MYNLKAELAMLRLEPLHRVSSNDRGRHNNSFTMRYFQESDNNYNECQLMPSYQFQYERPNCSRSLSITDVTYDNGNNNTHVNFDENDYDDVQEDENPRKGLLQQMFCLPLN